MVNKLRISVIICTNRKSPFFPNLLGNLLEQTVPPDEVVVVDDHSNAEWVKNCVTELRFTYEKQKVSLVYLGNHGPEGLTISRNLGAEASTGDIVVFLDDDVVPSKEYIEGLRDVYLSHPEALGVQGHITNWGNSGLLIRAFQKLFEMNVLEPDSCIILPSLRSVYPTRLTMVRNCQWLQGSNQSYRRVVFRNHRFDPNLRRPPSGEDVDFSYRVYCEHPESLFITPEARILHEGVAERRTNWRRVTYQQVVYKAYGIGKFSRIKGARVSLLSYAWERFGFLILQTTILVLGKGEASRRERADILHGILSGWLCVMRRFSDIEDGRLGFLGYGYTLKPIK